MRNNSTNSERIARNTIFLYIRMLLIMGVTLYTSRIILFTLGIVDFGIFNVVAGMASMFAFFSSSLSNVTQRFLNIEYGRKKMDSAKKVFNISAFIYFFLSLGVVLIAEIVGIWLIYHKLNIPQERLIAAIWVFQSMIFSLFFTLNGIVFQSVLIAHENMIVYAYIGLLEAAGRLAIAFIIGNMGSDRLILYAILFMFLSVSIQLFYAVYCQLHYSECQYKFVWDKRLFVKMFKFAGWNGFGTAVFAINFQGINILLNIFFGPIVNASKAVASQVDAAVNNFTMNFYTAVRPQIIKSYAAKEYKYFINLLFFSSRYAYYLMLALCIPIWFRIDTILLFWLKTPPEYSASFVQWVLLYSLINTLTNPFWTAIQATGHLKKYCLIGGCIFLSAFPISYLLLQKWSEPVLVFQVLTFVRLVYVFVVILIVRQYVAFPFRDYVCNVIFPILKVSVISISVACIVNRWVPMGIGGFLLACVTLFGITISTIYMVGISQSERAFIHKKIKTLYDKKDY